jgi:hypothetical protein
VGGLRKTCLAAALLALFLVAGCGSDGAKKAATRPAELFATPPAGLQYKVPDAATLKRVQGLLSQNQSKLEGDDVAVRQVLDGQAKDPIAVGIVFDAHNSGAPADALDGFNQGVKEKTGKPGTDVTIAGSKASVAVLAGTTVALTAKNGYVLEAIAADERTVKVVLARLVFAAGKATR